MSPPHNHSGYNRKKRKTHKNSQGKRLQQAQEVMSCDEKLKNSENEVDFIISTKSN
jgi:hypothetical protein